VTSSVVLSRCPVPMTAFPAIGDNVRQSAYPGIGHSRWIGPELSPITRAYL
jgi:hypothetical protein